MSQPAILPRGKLIVLACGGTGINIMTGSTGQKIKELTEKSASIASIKLICFDTSRVTIDSKPKIYDAFFKIEDESSSGKGIQGSGQERRTNAKPISRYVTDWAATNITPDKVDEFYLIVTSGSGGTGSVIAHMLTSELIARNRPVAVIVVGDTADHARAVNTYNTMLGLAKKAVMTQPLGVFYVDNKSGEKHANDVIEKFIISMLTLVSGQHHDLDFQDMRMLFRPSEIKSLPLPNGLYLIVLYNPNEKSPYAGSQIIMVRGLIDPAATKIDITTVSTKIGRYKNIDDGTPDTLLALINGAPAAIIDDLEKIVSEYDSRLKEIAITHSISSNREHQLEADETGLQL